MSLFGRAEIATMRDRTAARNYSPEGDAFRREHQRHRARGLRQRHAAKLRHAQRDRAAPVTAPASRTDPTRPTAPAPARKAAQVPAPQAASPRATPARAAGGEAAAPRAAAAQAPAPPAAPQTPAPPPAAPRRAASTVNAATNARSPSHVAPGRLRVGFPGISWSRRNGGFGDTRCRPMPRGLRGVTMLWSGWKDPTIAWLRGFVTYGSRTDVDRSTNGADHPLVGRRQEILIACPIRNRRRLRGIPQTGGIADRPSE
jgi:hypothetical protein